MNYSSHIKFVAKKHQRINLKPKTTLLISDILETVVKELTDNARKDLNTSEFIYPDHIEMAIKENFTKESVEVIITSCEKFVNRYNATDIQEEEKDPPKATYKTNITERNMKGIYQRCSVDAVVYMTGVVNWIIDWLLTVITDYLKSKDFQKAIVLTVKMFFYILEQNAYVKEFFDIFQIYDLRAPSKKGCLF
jgi:hypothetical protein